MTAVPGTSNGLKTDGSAVTQPVSAVSLPLPTGAATAAGQPTAAGSGSTTSGQTGNLDMAAVTSSSPAYTNGQTNALSLTTAGALRIDGSAATQPVSAASLPLPSGAATSANQATSAAQASTTSGQTGTLGMGATSTSAPSQTTGQTNPLSLTTSGALRTDLSGVTQPVSALALPLPTGAATSANQTNGSQVTTLAASAANGAATASTCSAIAPASLTTAQTCKASAGTVYDIQITSNVASGSGAYLKIYDVGSAPTCGASAGTPVARLAVPANATSGNEGGSNIVFPVGKAFASGIYWCVTGGLADNDATPLTANTIAINVDFK